jgi:hypothetical protein
MRSGSNFEKVDGNVHVLADSPLTFTVQVQDDPTDDVREPLV